MNDQTPAADLALDALDTLEAGLGGDIYPDEIAAAVAIIRDALADRITPAEARIIWDWEHRVPDGTFSPEETALIARLGKIAEAGR